MDKISQRQNPPPPHPAHLCTGGHNPSCVFCKLDIPIYYHIDYSLLTSHFRRAVVNLSASEKTMHTLSAGKLLKSSLFMNSVVINDGCDMTEIFIIKLMETQQHVDNSICYSFDEVCLQL